jgi:alanyl-tRNA synthetase
MQFERNASGELQALPNPSIDTGAGLERVAAVLQEVDSNYDTDLFQPILRATAELASKIYGDSKPADTSFRVIADHLRAVSFLLADGVIPGNEGRGYVLRRLLRRAVRHGMRLDFEEPFLYRLQPILADLMGPSYSELNSTQQESVEMIRAEEEKFFSTVATASRMVQEEIDGIRESQEQVLSGPVIFKLYDTFGLPIEIVREIAEEEQVELDEQGFEAALATQRSRSRAAGGEDRKKLSTVANLIRTADPQPKSTFVGYDQLAVQGSQVLQLASFGGEQPALVSALSTEEEGVVVLDRTAFYGESGGQIGDEGTMTWPNGVAEVTDTQKGAAGTHLQLVRVSEGVLSQGQLVDVAVEVKSRLAIQRNHTATHLLHAALRHVLGSGVRQAGSLVAIERLRFDFTYHQVPSPEQLELVEELTNRWILRAEDVEIDDDRSYREAVDAGAMALFGEKYGDRVRTIEIPGFDIDLGSSPGRLNSLELCGGCHVRNTGEIGIFVITAERGVASGVRRIEALTGGAARDHLMNRSKILGEVSSELGVASERASAEVGVWRNRIRDLENTLAELRMHDLSDRLDEGMVSEVEGVKLQIQELPTTPVNELREMADLLKSKLGSGIVVLGTRSEGKVGLVIGVTKDLTDRLHAGRLAKKVAAMVGGKGGGRPDFAQAGGRDAESLPAALESVPQLVAEELVQE